MVHLLKEISLVILNGGYCCIISLTYYLNSCHVTDTVKHTYKSRFERGIFGSYIRGSLISVGHSELKQGFGIAGFCSYKRVSLISAALISVVHCIGAI